MNIYDEANNLARAIKNSIEYKRMIETQEIVKQNPRHWEMVGDFMKKQFEVQSMQMMGQKLSDSQIDAFNNMASTIMNIPVIKDYFEAQMIFMKIYQDVMKIISADMDLNLGM